MIATIINYDKKKEQPNMWITSINDFKGQIWIKGAYLQCGWEMAE